MHTALVEPPFFPLMHFPWAILSSTQLEHLSSLHTFWMKSPVDGGDGGVGPGGVGGVGPGPGPLATVEEHGYEVMRHWSVPFCTRIYPFSPQLEAQEFLMIQYGGVLLSSNPTTKTP